MIQYGRGEWQDNENLTGALLTGKFAKFLGLVRERGPAITASDRSGRVSNDGIKHLFGNAAAKARSLGCMSPRVVRRQLGIFDANIPNPCGDMLPLWTMRFCGSA